MFASDELDHVNRIDRHFRRDWHFPFIYTQKLISTRCDKKTIFKILQNLNENIVKNLNRVFNAAYLSYKLRMKITNDVTADIEPKWMKSIPKRYNIDNKLSCIKILLNIERNSNVNVGVKTYSQASRQSRDLNWTSNFDIFWRENDN